jgi:hypothetical protein
MRCLPFAPGPRRRDVNDAERLCRDPVMRWVVSDPAIAGFPASASQTGRFETKWLCRPENRLRRFRVADVLIGSPQATGAVLALPGVPIPALPFSRAAEPAPVVGGLRPLAFVLANADTEFDGFAIGIPASVFRKAEKHLGIVRSRLFLACS